MAICDDETEWEIMNGRTVKTVLTLFRTRNHILESNQKIINQHGLTWAQFVTLSALRQSPSPHQLLPTELYGAVQVTSGGMTKILDSLENSNYISRIINPADRRGSFAKLTSSGTKLVEDISEKLSNHNKIIFNNALSSKEQAKLALLIDKLCLPFDQGTSLGS